MKRSWLKKFTRRDFAIQSRGGRFGLLILISVWGAPVYGAEERSGADSVAESLLRIDIAKAWSSEPARANRSNNGAGGNFASARSLLFAATEESDFRAEERFNVLAEQETSRVVSGAVSSLSDQTIGGATGQLRHEAKWNRRAAIFNLFAGIAAQAVQLDASSILRAFLEIGRIATNRDILPRERKEQAILEDWRSALVKRDSWAQVSKPEAQSRVKRLDKLRQRADRTDQKNIEATSAAAWWLGYDETARSVRSLLKDERTGQFEKRLRKTAAQEERVRASRLRFSPDYRPDDLASTRRLLLTYPTSRVRARTGDENNVLESHQAYSQQVSGYYNRGVWRYIIGGNRDAAEAGYLGLYIAAGGSGALAPGGLFFGLDALLRGITAMFRPVGPWNLVLREHLKQAHDPRLPIPVRHEALDVASTLLARAGFKREALYVAESAHELFGLPPLPASRVRELRAEAATQMLRRARAAKKVRDKQDGLRYIIELFPKTEAAQKAKESLEKMEAPTGVSSDGSILHISRQELNNGGEFAALRPILPVRDFFFEKEPKAGGMNGFKLRRPLSRNGGTDQWRFTLFVGENAKQHRAIDAATGQAIWQAARGLEWQRLLAEGRELSQRQILPLGIEGGIGGSGVDFQPTMKRYPFRGGDAHLYR